MGQLELMGIFKQKATILSKNIKNPHV